MWVLSLTDTPDLLKINHPYVDLIEWRLDLAPLNLSIAKKIQRPWIATVRDKTEGGQFNGPHHTRLSILKKALEHGARWVDIEARFDRGHIPISKCIRSVHFQQDTSKHHYQRTLNQLLQSPGSLLKWVRPTNFAQDLSCYEKNLLRQSQRPVIMIHQGLGGQWTRAQPPGHPWSYICESDDQATASGQLCLKDIPHHEGGPLYGILGNPVAHSLSPRYHNHYLRQHHLDGLYVYLPVDDLDVFFNSIAQQFTGFSVTTPFKEKILQHADEQSAICKETNCANTLVKKNNKWLAFNTDALAFKTLLTKQRKPHQNQVTILGSGSTARSAIWACQQLGLTITIGNRTTAKGEQLAKSTQSRFVPMSSWSCGDEDIIIQTTSAEMMGHSPPFDTGSCRNETLLIESIYSKETSFLNNAPTSTTKINGVDLFLAQADEQTKLLYGTS